MNEMIMEDCGSLEYTLIEAEPIIGFNLWGERRICLPQLLRFILPNFDINVIDGAVTDLQINCFQCNSDQMHLLHAENIVPKEIIRCGLIRKSDAERLCKYLLQRNQKCDKSYDILSCPSQKSIMVVHSCFGEQCGTLIPAVYISADSKCIKCFSCNYYFKTFEFVGHTHKLDEVVNTFHWGFDSNNWRLLLQLYSDDKNGNINDLNEGKAILDGVKSKFYEEELNKTKSRINVVWRPSRRLKLPNAHKQTTFSFKPSHLNYGPVEVYTKPINKCFDKVKVESSRNENYAPNVYLDPKDSSSTLESNIDDDDNEEYDDIVEKKDDVAMSIALQIKREAIPTDLINLGTLSTFVNKESSIITQSNSPTSMKSYKSNCNPLVVAQPQTSIPTQFLMLEALWSQLFRDIIQLTHLVQFNTNDERNRLVGQLIRWQELFRTQWTNLAEENQSLKKTLALEIKQHQDINIVHDQLKASLEEITIENNDITERVKQLEKRCEQFKGNIVTNSETDDLNKYTEKNNSGKTIEEFQTYKTNTKRHLIYDDNISQEDAEESGTKKHLRKHSINNDI